MSGHLIAGYAGYGSGTEQPIIVCGMKERAETGMTGLVTKCGNATGKPLYTTESIKMVQPTSVELTLTGVEGWKSLYLPDGRGTAILQSEETECWLVMGIIQNLLILQFEMLLKAGFGFVF